MHGRRGFESEHEPAIIYARTIKVITQLACGITEKSLQDTTNRPADRLTDRLINRVCDICVVPLELVNIFTS